MLPNHVYNKVLLSELGVQWGVFEDAIRKNVSKRVAEGQVSEVAGIFVGVISDPF